MLRNLQVTTFLP